MRSRESEIAPVCLAFHRGQFAPWRGCSLPRSSAYRRRARRGRTRPLMRPREDRRVLAVVEAPGQREEAGPLRWKGIPPPNAPIRLRSALLRPPLPVVLRTTALPPIRRGPATAGAGLRIARIPGLVRSTTSSPTVEALEEVANARHVLRAERNVQERLNALDARLLRLDLARPPAGWRAAALMLAFRSLAARRSSFGRRWGLAPHRPARPEHAALVLRRSERTEPATVVPASWRRSRRPPLSPLPPCFTRNRFAVRRGRAGALPGVPPRAWISTETRTRRDRARARERRPLLRVQQSARDARAGAAARRLPARRAPPAWPSRSSPSSPSARASPVPTEAASSFSLAGFSSCWRPASAECR